jgi:hypothetical protein
MIARFILIVCLAAPLGGCSLVFTSGPPSLPERGRAFACTTSFAAPLLDLLWVTYAFAATAAEKTGGLGVEDVALSSIWIGSAAYGGWNASRCRAAIRNANRRADSAQEHRERLHLVPLGPVANRSWPRWKPTDH